MDRVLLLARRWRRRGAVFLGKRFGPARDARKAREGAWRSRRARGARLRWHVHRGRRPSA